MSFNPTEIIFSATSACNLHCPHCFVSRIPNKLSIQEAQDFINNCISSHTKNPELPQIQRIGFSGGEPFLYLDFLTSITQTAIKTDLLFDQIMTNGDWWKDESDLQNKLQLLYDAGYDGKIGLSCDSFHNQDPQRIIIFIRNVQKIFGENSINIQTVIPHKDYGIIESNKIVEIKKEFPEIQIYNLPQMFPSSDPRAWKFKRWFKEDFCEGPGQILYVHSDGNIAPCCGFANENKELFIGKITDSLETIMSNAKSNKMIQICFDIGLSKYKKELKRKLRKQNRIYPGKCNDICSFCDFVCNTIFK